MLCQAWSKRMLDTHRPVYGDDLQPLWSSFCDAPWLKTWWWGIHQHVLYVPWSMDLSPHFMGISWDINGISWGSWWNLSTNYNRRLDDTIWYPTISAARSQSQVSQGYEDDVWGWRRHVSEGGEVGEVPHLHPVPWQVWLKMGSPWEISWFHRMV